MATAPNPAPQPERHNGLIAETYRRLQSVDHRELTTLLEAMTDAEVACFSAIPTVPDAPMRDVYVDAEKFPTAREVADEAHRAYANRRIDIGAAEVDARFAALIDVFDGPSDVPDLTEAEQPRAATTREPDVDPDFGDLFNQPPPIWRAPSADSLSDPPEDPDDDFVPEPPRPLPKPTAKVAIGLLLIVAGCVGIFAPQTIPLPATACLVLGVALLAGGTGLLVMQLRDGPEDPFDDGARV